LGCPHGNDEDQTQDHHGGDQPYPPQPPFWFSFPLGHLDHFSHLEIQTPA